MRYITLIFLISSILLSSCKENKKSSSERIKIEIKDKLETILLKDQGIREIVSGNLSDERKNELLTQMGISESDIKGNKAFDLMNEIDSTNLLEIDSIINIYGYPSKSLVGERANNAVFYVIQHSNKIGVYLPLIREAAKNGDVDKILLAKMEDRNLMYEGIEQIYGTQIKGQVNKKGEWIYYLWPVKNADSINIWRKNVGFKETVEEYVKEMGIEFKLYKLNEINDL